MHAVVMPCLLCNPSSLDTTMHLWEGKGCWKGLDLPLDLVFLLPCDGIDMVPDHAAAPGGHFLIRVDLHKLPDFISGVSHCQSLSQHLPARPIQKILIKVNPLSAK